MSFYISSTDYYEFEEPRKIIKYEKHVLNGLHCLIAWIDPPVLGQNYGWGERNIDKVILVPRFEEDALQQLKDFPIEVHVFVPADLSNPEQVRPWKEMKNIGWVRLYKRFQDARQHKI